MERVRRQFQIHLLTSALVLAAFALAGVGLVLGGISFPNARFILALPVAVVVGVRIVEAINLRRISKALALTPDGPPLVEWQYRNGEWERHLADPDERARRHAQAWAAFPQALPSVAILLIIVLALAVLAILRGHYLLAAGQALLGLSMGAVPLLEAVWTARESEGLLGRDWHGLKAPATRVCLDRIWSGPHLVIDCHARLIGRRTQVRDVTVREGSPHRLVVTSAVPASSRQREHEFVLPVPDDRLDEAHAVAARLRQHHADRMSASSESSARHRVLGMALIYVASGWWGLWLAAIGSNPKIVLPRSMDTDAVVAHLLVVTPFFVALPTAMLWLGSLLIRPAHPSPISQGWQLDRDGRPRTPRRALAALLIVMSAAVLGSVLLLLSRRISEFYTSDAGLPAIVVAFGVLTVLYVVIPTGILTSSRWTPRFLPGVAPRTAAIRTSSMPAWLPAIVCALWLLAVSWTLVRRLESLDDNLPGPPAELAALTLFLSTILVLPMVVAWIGVRLWRPRRLFAWHR